jgi:hypothetical protein
MFVVVLTPVAHETATTVGAILKENNDFCLNSMDELKNTWPQLEFSRDWERGVLIAYGSEKDMLSLFDAVSSDEDWSVGVWTV